MVPRDGGGFNVSRETIAGGTTESLRNERGRVELFRSLAKADAACRRANFAAQAAALAQDPLLAPAQAGGAGPASMTTLTHRGPL